MSDKSIAQIWGKRAVIALVAIFIIELLILRGHWSSIFERKELRDSKELYDSLLAKYGCDGDFCINERCTDDKGVCALVITDGSIHEIKRRGRTLCYTLSTPAQWVLAWVQSPIDLQWYGAYAWNQIYKEQHPNFLEYIDSIGVAHNPGQRTTPMAFRFQAPEQKGAVEIRYTRLPYDEICDDCAVEEVCNTDHIRWILN